MTEFKETVEEGKAPILKLLAIDLTRTDHENIRNELDQQMQNVGFLLLKNVPGYDEAEYLEACKAFHQMPQELKETLYLKHQNPSNSNVYRGYFPFAPNDASHKEFYDLNMKLDGLSEEEKALPLYEEAPFPSDPQYEWIQKVFFKVREAWLQTALRVLEYLAVSLNLDKEEFRSWFAEGSLSTLRTIHYESRNTRLVDSNSLDEYRAGLTTPEHVDSGFLTFLATFGYPGLQVLHQGVYKDVNVEQNALVVNLGATCAALTNHKYAATMHRVLDIGRERYSSPLFFEPKYSAQIPRAVTEAAEDLATPCHMYGDMLIARMTKLFVEFKDFHIPEDRRQLVDAIPVGPPAKASM